jgi:hypothetical protein
LGFKSSSKSLRKLTPDRVVDIDHPNAINYILDNHPDPVTNHPNRF